MSAEASSSAVQSRAHAARMYERNDADRTAIASLIPRSADAPYERRVQAVLAVLARVPAFGALAPQAQREIADEALAAGDTGI